MAPTSTSVRAAAVVAAAVAALSACSVHALYFHVTEGQQRCFVEEVPGDTLIVGTYKNPDFVPWGRDGFSGVVRAAAGR